MKQYGSASGTSRYYVVEARMNYPEPKEYRGMILDAEWRRVRFERGPVGVSAGCFDPQARQLGLLSHDAAMALAYWFMSAPLLGSLCIQTRLVEVEFIYKYEAQERGVGPTLEVYQQMRDTKFTPREGEPAREDGR